VEWDGRDMCDPPRRESVMTSMIVTSLPTNTASTRTVPEATQQQIPTEEELARPPPVKPSFSPSTGVSLRVDDAGATATLTMEKSQLLVSGDWISPQHAVKTRSWKVQCCGDLSNGYNTFVGITQAPCFGEKGFTLVFDANGHTQHDNHPLLLGFTYMYEHRNETDLAKAVEFDSFPVQQCKAHTFQVNVNIEKLTLTMKISKKTIKADLSMFCRDWDQVRLAVLVQPGNEDQRRVRLLTPSEPTLAA